MERERSAMMEEAKAKVRAGERIHRGPLHSLWGGGGKHGTLTFLHALTIFFKSYSEESPCTVVKVLRPFRCWILI